LKSYITHCGIFFKAATFYVIESDYQSSNHQVRLSVAHVAVAEGVPRGSFLLLSIVKKNPWLFSVHA
jgi:hypothetical protein